jgi:hypothetical protein
VEGALGVLGWSYSCQLDVFTLHQDNSTGTSPWSRIKIERLFMLSSLLM